jgi:hypothetical protein
MIVTPETWVPGAPTVLQQRFIDLNALAAAGTQIAFTGYDPSKLTLKTPVAGANTGTGNVSKCYLLSPAVAETWTLTCKADVTKFTVVGSVTGAKADATVNRDYVTTHLSFFISSGPIAFVAGDTFSIVVTATAQNPEGAITGDGFAQSYKETTTHLNEVIYTK